MTCSFEWGWGATSAGVPIVRASMTRWRKRLGEAGGGPGRVELDGGELLGNRLDGRRIKLS